MTYNEWRDELKSNLLSVSDAERRRVLDYYAEAYADRREAGFSEREIIDEFGAPYDAAQRILSENSFQASKAVRTEPERENGDNGEKRANIYGQPPQGKVQGTPPVVHQSTESSKKKKGMSRGTKIALWVLAGILIAGIITFIVLFAIGFSIHPEFADAHYTQQVESVQTVRIDAEIGEVETVFYEGDRIEIDYHTSNIYDVDISEKGGTLCYKLHIKRWLMLHGTINHPKTTIKLPAGNVYDIDIDMSAGAATVNGGTFGNIKIDLSAGAVNISGDTVCKSLDIDLSAGKVNVGKVECAGSIIIDLSAGGVEVGEAVCNRIGIDLSAGTVKIRSLTCPKIDIDLSAGTVNLTIAGQQSEYTIAVDKSAGKCNVGNQRGTDDGKIIDIDLSAGTVTLDFAG